GQAFPGAVIEDRQDAEAPAAGELIGDEVERPAVVGHKRHRHRSARSQSPFAAAALPYHQPFLAIDAEQPFVIHDVALPAQQHMQAPVAKAAAFLRQSSQSFAQLRIVRTPRSVADGHSYCPNHRARPPLAHLVGDLQMSDSLSLDGGRHHFFDKRAFGAALSSIESAKSFCSFAFSVSNAFSFRASETSIPPNFDFHLKNVALLIPCFRQTSAVLAPASCSRRIPMI